MNNNITVTILFLKINIFITCRNIKVFSRINSNVLAKIQHLWSWTFSQLFTSYFWPPCTCVPMSQVNDTKAILDALDVSAVTSQVVTSSQCQERERYLTRCNHCQCQWQTKAPTRLLTIVTQPLQKVFPVDAASTSMLYYGRGRAGLGRAGVRTSWFLWNTCNFHMKNHCPA